MRNKNQRYTPVPDEVIKSALNDSQIQGFIDPNQALIQSKSGSESVRPEQSVIGASQLRGKLLTSSLDKASETVGNVTAVNRSGYLTALDSMKVTSETEINDVKRARLLYRQMTKNNPTNTAGWLAAARLEEYDGKIQEARNIMLEACSKLPDKEDIWIEASRLAPATKTK